MIATDSYVGVKASEKYAFSIFTCPVGAYYKGSVKVRLSENSPAQLKEERAMQKQLGTMLGRYTLQCLRAKKVMTS